MCRMTCYVIVTGDPGNEASIAKAAIVLDYNQTWLHSQVLPASNGKLSETLE